MTHRYALPEGCPKHSPWGAVDHGVRYAGGVYFVSTPSHGGFRLKRDQNAMIPVAFRRDDGWYEEDCDWAIPVFFLPILEPEKVAAARESLRCWRWREWEAHFGEIVPLEESLCKAQAMFIEEHANDLLVNSASCDWHLAWMPTEKKA